MSFRRGECGEEGGGGRQIVVQSFSRRQEAAGGGHTVRLYKLVLLTDYIGTFEETVLLTG